ncbi:exodeoxyribonuclease VII, large subunit [Methylobacterium sp. 4-46]|uniref:exodeoxyribonuclease VII large subunit n=1 Tax=unclassified Methylobacterium TaxID=2615210 RepID=UPI000152D50C|nr:MULTISPECIES: exodeoxyribonuclease VII large subunit [Methylobacterium]ACA20345.1 exodeoxyribonuclease VII, large subunit [Methylobacterium sp. 4-46]WFT79516.1 exodeoxyribonuclease VII large subunit [Methylobacterium nodulans]
MSASPLAASLAAPPGAPANLTEWSVTDLAAALKRTLEDAFGHVRLRGEISGYRGPHGSGHAYFSLKDGGAKIDAVIWKGTLARLRHRPKEGLEVVATGRITTFPGKSAYQIVIDSLEPAGAGAWMALLEERRRLLAAEGLFDAARKRPLPYLPRVVGVVTSPTGAVIRDILHRLADRFPRPVLVWPVRVQGEGSAEEVAAAIRGFNALAPDGPIPRPDVLIVARGGGSIEDLWSFNEEIVVRAAAASAIPLIAAVGHETDVTLIDHAADRRAPTPTGAAEMAVPVRLDLVADLDGLARRHAASLARLIERRRADLRGLARVLPTPEGLLAVKRQRLDLAEARLRPALGEAARAAQGRLARLLQALGRHPPALHLARARARLAGIDHRPRHALERLIAVRAERLNGVAQRLAQAESRDLERRRARFAAASGLFDSLNYRAVLQRGYALVLDAEGRPVAEAEAARAAGRITVEFQDGKVGAVVEGAPPRRAAAKRGPAAPARQTSLFDL